MLRSQQVEQLWNSIRALFADKLLMEGRPTPFVVGRFTFAADSSYELGIVASTNVAFHVQIILSLCLQIVLLQIFAMAIWYGVILPQQRSTNNKPSSRAVVCGLGLIIPLSFVLPILLLNLWDIRNTAVRFGCILLPLMVPFKCLEALFGSHNSLSQQHRQSLTSYRYYAGYPLLPKMSEKDGVVPLQRQDIRVVSQHFLFWLVIMTILYSLMEPFDFRPFPVLTRTTTSNSSYLPTLDPGRMYNSFAQACLFFSTLIFAMKTTGLLCMLFGHHAVDHFVFDRQPLVWSTSPRDFWGYRWNTLIHHHLKVGVYKPTMQQLLRHNCSERRNQAVVIATLATFLASALIHEFVSYIQFFRTDTQLQEGAPYYAAGVWGKHLVFFGWNALLIVSQDLVQQPMERLTKSWPGWFKSHLVVLLAMPVGHCFMDDISDGGYFRHLQPVIPMIVVRKVTSAAASAYQ